MMILCFPAGISDVIVISLRTETKAIFVQHEVGAIFDLSYDIP